METQDGVRLAVEVHKGGTPAGCALLLIPGWGTSRRTFDPLIPYLTPFSRVITYDPRGLGESGMSDPPWTSTQLVDDALSVVQAVEGEAKVDVFGVSMGGGIAQQLAVDHPDRVRRLILAATALGGKAIVSFGSEARDRLLGRGTRTPEAAYRIASTVLYSERFLREHADFIDGEARERGTHPVRAKVHSAQNQATAEINVAGRLAALRIPTLILHGTEDAVIPLSDAEMLESRIPGARHHWFEGLGHVFIHEDPVAVARTITEFLAG